MTIHFLLTCYNRVAMTLRLLESLAELRETLEGRADAVRVEVFLTDDGSTDGTSELVTEEHPWVQIVNGSGSLFWNRGMIAAFEASRRSEIPTAYVLVNDDLELNIDVAVRMIDDVLRGHFDVLVGQTTDTHGEVTYGGFSDSSAIRPLTFARVIASKEPTECATFNANFVVLTSRSFLTVGGLDSRFEHGLGDLELGLRLRRAGFTPYVSNESIGVCVKGDPMSVRLGQRSVADRFRAEFNYPNSFRQYLYFVRQSKGFFSFCLYMLTGFASRISRVFRFRR